MHHFPAHIFSDQMMPGYPHKASYFEYRLCHKIYSGEDRVRNIEINCTDDNCFLSDRVCTQSKKLKEDILVAFDRGKCGLGYSYNVFEHPCSVSKQNMGGSGGGGGQGVRTRPLKSQKNIGLHGNTTIITRKLTLFPQIDVQDTIGNKKSWQQILTHISI